MSLLVLSGQHASDISADIPPDDLINLMAGIFARFTLRSGVVSPHRTSIVNPCHNVLFMPSRVEGSGTAIKIVSVSRSSDDDRGLPASTLVIDEDSGRVKAIVNARKLTALRNAAGSCLATKLALGPTAKPKTLVAFGAGAQIEAHADLLLRTFPLSLKTCVIFNRTMNSRLQDLLSVLEQKFPSVTFVARKIPTETQSLEDSQEFKRLIQSADIICTATSSTQPLFPGRYVRPGTHVNLVGSYKPSMIEIDSDLVNRAGMIIVDSKDACSLEAGDLISAGVGEGKMIELGELVTLDDLTESTHAGGFKAVEERCSLVRNAGDVTIFKSVGIGIQDVAIASLVIKFAEETQVGVWVQSYD